MKRILTYKGAVMTWECDSNQHMNVMYYINKFESAGRNFGMHIGFHDLMSKEVGSVVVEQTIKYIKEVFEDDLLYVESSLLKVGNKSSTVLHEMYNSVTKEKVAEMKLVLVLFDKVNRKALEIPEATKETMKNLIESI